MIEKRVGAEEATDNIHRRVPIRELIAWLIGGIIGTWVGVRAGLILGGNVAPGAGGVIGWFVTGFLFWRVTRACIRSTPQLTISVRAARDAFFGMMLGCFFGSFLTNGTNTHETAGILIGMIAGLVTGALIGENSAKVALRNESESKSTAEDGR